MILFVLQDEFLFDLPEKRTKSLSDINFILHFICVNKLKSRKKL